MIDIPTNDPCPPALTADAMRKADRYTMEEFGLPSPTLMEAAGRGCAERIQEAYGPLDGTPVTILCGKGNNGGDGLVVARRLFAAGARIRVVLTAPAEELGGDPAHNLTLLRTLQQEAADGDRLALDVVSTPDALSILEAPRPDVIIDALLGTGLTSALREPIDSIVDWANAQAAPVVALDVPTGLHSDTGEVMGTAIEADRTVTMAAPKVGLCVGEGPSLAGTVDVVDIGIPAFVMDRAAEAAGCVRQTTDAAVRQWWPERDRAAYKYSVGTALVLGGAPRFSGAPTMASRAAERSGAGYVSCACPETIQSTVAAGTPSVPTVPLPTTDEGGLDPDGALDVLSDVRADALLVGPGLGRATGTEHTVRRLVETTERPLVLDADGLNALAGHAEALLPRANGRWILTPHAGEFRRLAQEDVDLTDRVRVVQAYAQRWNVVLLLKGTPSLVAGPDGRTFVNRTGTPALAMAGSGDVLAGQCVGLLAQGLSPLHAAAAAMHLGGAAARRYARTRDPRTMTAPDLIEELPRSTAERLRARGREGQS
ncbi:MAG: NAD(P)H-hydrate dehydratase [Salinibacter sp.]